MFDDWDTDDNNEISKDEFNAGIGDNDDEFGARFGDGVYAEWDEDDDNALTEDESTGRYAGYDDDNVIEEPGTRRPRGRHGRRRLLGRVEASSFPGPGRPLRPVQAPTGR